MPDYELSDHTAKRRKLSELQEQHPMVLVLSRGGFCPKDCRQHEGLIQLHRELEVEPTATVSSRSATRMATAWLIQEVKQRAQDGDGKFQVTEPHSRLLPAVAGLLRDR